ncbi:MAG: YeiH family protein [Thermoplasmatota archaeon]
MAPTWNTKNALQRLGWRGALLATGIVLCLTPWATPPLALGAGIIIALTAGNPFAATSSKASKTLLKASVVTLGFGISLSQLFVAGVQGVTLAVGTIIFALAVGIALGVGLGVARDTSWLISGGTAICGGSAIAAIGPAIRARAESMNVALATVFILNSLALYLFPMIGHWAGLSQNQFGVWAALAIHDTSSVVGAGASYGPTALSVATVTKLARAIWIAPVALIFAWAATRAARRDGNHMGPTKVEFPWFIALFGLATVVRSLAPLPAWIFADLTDLGTRGLVLTLFLIGAGLTRSALRAVGARPFMQGVTLWAIVSVVSFLAVRSLIH